MASYRNYLIAKGLDNLGYEINVLSTSNKKYYPTQNEELNSIKVDYLPTLDYRSFNKSSSISGISKTGSPLKRLFRRLKNSYPLNLVLDLGGLLYIIAGISKGNRLIRKNKCQLIISNYPPVSNLIIASWLKFLNPQIKWIVDFHHFHISSDGQNVIFPNFQKRWIHYLLKKSDYLITVSEGLTKRLSQLNPRIEVIELSFDESEHKAEPRDIDTNYLFTITYCGSLYDQQTFRILKNVVINLHENGKINVAKIKFVYAGANDKEWVSRLKQSNVSVPFIIQNLGVISRQKCLNLMNKSNINLLLSWNEKDLKTIIPGKYYDYLLAAKPIVLIINGEKDIAWENRFKALKPGFMCYEKDQIEDLEQFILKEYDNWKLGLESNVKMNNELLSNHSINTQIKKLDAIIQEKI